MKSEILTYIILQKYFNLKNKKLKIKKIIIIIINIIKSKLKQKINIIFDDKPCLSRE